MRKPTGRQKPRRYKCGAGFTLIESLLAIVVIAALAVAVAHIMIEGLSTYSTIVERREALQGARLAVNMMSAELQAIADPATDIQGISAGQLTFRPPAGGQVTYSIAGGELKRGDDILARGVTAGSGFAYFTAGGAATSDPSAVHRIHIAVEVEANSPSHGRVMIQSNVYLRNRYYDGFTQI